jgi:hypothetical protein
MPSMLVGATMPAICATSPSRNATRRDALVACYLTGSRKTLLDQIVEMYDLFLIEMNRRARHAVEEKRKALQRQSEEGLDHTAGAVGALVAADGTQTVAEFREIQSPLPCLLSM